MSRSTRRVLLLAFAMTALVATPRAFAFDLGGYRTKLAAVKADIATKQLADPKTTIAQLDDLTAMGAAAAREYGAKQAKFAKLMAALVADIPAMKSYSDTEMEAKWGEQGTGGDTVGVPIKSLGQFDDTRANMELVLAPATANIYVSKWTTAKKARWLEQARDELAELETHIQKIH